MPRRGENIYKRKDGRWEGRILKANGKYKYVYAQTYKEVKNKKNNYQEYDKNTKNNSQFENVSNMFNYWLQKDVISRVKMSTYESYSVCIQSYVIPFYQNEGYKYITEPSVLHFVKAINGNTSLSETYKRKLISIFKTSLKDILKSKPEQRDIVNSVKLPKTDNTEIHVFSIREQRLIENVVFQVNDMKSIGILLAFYTGIRLGELCALKWCDIDSESCIMSISKTVTRVKNHDLTGRKTILSVGSPKSKKAIRKIPLPVFFKPLYMRLGCNSIDENYYFLSGTSQPLDPRTYQMTYKRILLEAGIKERKFHATRHTFATRALELGVDIKTLSEILGHANVSITLNIYAHSLMEQKKLVMDKFNDLYIAHRSNVSSVVKNSVIKV